MASSLIVNAFQGLSHRQVASCCSTCPSIGLCSPPFGCNTLPLRRWGHGKRNTKWSFKTHCATSACHFGFPSHPGLGCRARSPPTPPGASIEKRRYGRVGGKNAAAKQPPPWAVTPRKDEYNQFLYIDDPLGKISYYGICGVIYLFSEGISLWDRVRVREGSVSRGNDG